MKKRLTSIFPPSAFRTHPFSECGIALVLTLGILAIVTLLVIAFATSMRVENMASKNFNDAIKARELAKAAVDRAVATIREATPVITPTATYVTSPGVIYTRNGANWTPYTLFTLGNNWDLNAGNLITGTNADYQAIPHTPLSVGWQSITINTPLSPNELVGRFAYWVDDESAKVDINVAGTRGNDLEGWTPAAIDLQALFPYQDQSNITYFASKVGPFDTLESVKQVTNNPLYVGYPFPLYYIDQNKYYTNQLYMTVNSTSPDLTAWGTKRLNLSNVVATAVSPQAAVNIISNALADANLTTWFGQNFVGKYPSVAQIAANIVDYIDGDNIPTDSTAVGPLDTFPPSYLGLEQTPYINELVITNTVTAANLSPGTWTLAFSTLNTVELWYMYTNSAGWALPPGTTEVILMGRPSITITPVPPGTANGVASLPLTLPTTGTITVNSGMAAGSFVPLFNASDAPTPSVGSLPVTMTTNLASIAFNAGVVTAIFRNQTLGRYDYAVIPLTNYTINIDANVTALTNQIWASACNDPRVKPVSTYWTPVGPDMAHGITLGSDNVGVRDMSTGAGGILGDGDISCHIISGSRDRGTMYPGELAFIHTGVPWRTFRLQPQIAGEPAPPDWAVLDLFSATDTTNVVGRVNINGSVINAGNTVPPRLAPLNALLTNNLPIPSAYLKGRAGANIDAFVLGTTNGLPFNQNQYTMVGQICETKGLATNDLLLSSKAIAETPARGIANIITTRSNIFTIWAIAQSIKEPNLGAAQTFGAFQPGVDLITGEVKVQAIVERYENPAGTVKFRTKYFRYIYQ